MLRLSTTAAVALLALGSLSCDLFHSNRAPTVNAINGPAGVQAGKSVRYTCDASDPDGDELTFLWTCSAGTLAYDSGVTVTWTAPGVPDSVRIEVTARDPDGATDLLARDIEVTPGGTRLVDWSGNVQAGVAYVWHFDPEAGALLSGEFTVDTLGLNFLILDDPNFEKWMHAEPFDALVRHDGSAGASFEVTVPTSDTHHAILDNSDFPFVDKFVTLLICATDP